VPKSKTKLPINAPTNVDFETASKLDDQTNNIKIVKIDVYISVNKKNRELNS
jgi:hypothetical protein